MLRLNGPPSLVLVFLTCGLFSVACSSADFDSDLPDEDNQGDGDTSGDGDSTSTLAFEPGSTLTLKPGEVAELRVRIAPPNRQTVSFDLLTDIQNFDGFLLEGSAKVQDSGIATVNIQAPSKPATFAVRAKLGELEARLAVAVSAQGFGTLMVRPKYSGKREIKRFTASARAGMTCDDLTSYWQDGPLVATGTNVAKVEFVPSGVSIAVSVRGDELVSGCTTLTNIKADETLDVSVPVNDRPLGINSSKLSLSLGIDSSTTLFAQHLDEAIQLALESWRGEATSDANALFEAIHSQVPSEALTAFEENATAYQFENLISSRWENATPLSTALGKLLTDATGKIPSSTTFQGTLTLSGNDSQLNLLTAAGVPAEQAGFVPESDWSVNAESTTTLILGGVLEYRPLTWLTALATHDSVSSPQETLAIAAGCEVIVIDWVNASENEIYPNCDEACTALRCQQAIDTIWQDVSTFGELAALQIGVTGEAETSGSAEVSGLVGTWIGRFGDGETSLRGPAVGAPLLP